LATGLGLPVSAVAAEAEREAQAWNAYLQELGN
jgi:hypothetical protein